jgi:osmotically-inducible protein OsmY
MGRKIRSLIVAGGLALAGVAAFSACSKGDRGSAQYVDDRMTTHRVKSDLKKNPSYKFDQVQVNTYKGVVQLRGWVPNTEQKRIASNLAKNVPGVLDVVDNIEVTPQVQSLTPTGQSQTGRPLSEQQIQREPQIQP